MINEESLKIYCSEFSKIDGQIIYDYFHYADEKEPFTIDTIKSTKTLINKLLKEYKINELTYEFIHFSFEKSIGAKKKLFYKFIFFLCYKHYIPYCNFYRLLRFEKYIFNAHLPRGFNYWIDLEDKYYNLFLKSEFANSNTFKTNLLFFHLDKNNFIDSTFYELCQSSIEYIKFTFNMNPICLEGGLETLRRAIYSVARINPQDFEEKDFISITQRSFSYHKELLFTFFNLLQKGGYTSNPIILQTVQLLESLKIDFNINYFRYIPKIIETGKPKLWIKLGKHKLMFVNCSNSRTLFILKEFSKQSYVNVYVFEVYLKYFDNSLINSSGLLSFYSYLEQIKYFKDLNELRSKRDKDDMLSLIHSFYTFYQTYEPDVFSKNGYPTALLATVKIANYIANDYEVVNHNPLVAIPESNNWLFCYKDTYSSNLIKIKRFSLTKIKNPIFREWYKSYIWHCNIKMQTAIHHFRSLLESLNYITDLKSGDILSFFNQEKNDNYGDINSQEIRALKNYVLSTYSNNQTQAKYIYNLKSLLNYISDNNIHNFDRGVFIELSLPINYDSNQNPIPIEHINLISKRILELSHDNVLYKLYCVIFYIAIETSFRPSQILNLKVDCVRPTAKNNEYIIYSETKTSNQEEIEQPISIYVKRCIDEAIRLTNGFRINNTYTELNRFIFIIPSKLRKYCYHRINTYEFNSCIHKICDELKLPCYSFQNLRDFHMTMAEEYIIRQKLSDSQLKILTHHKSTQTTLQHYSKPSITEILEAVNGVIIGNVDIKGNVIKQLPKEIDEHSDLVSESCGYCSSRTCSCFTDIDCLLCEHFVTTFSRKCYFEERIKMLDTMIPSAIHPHDKEDLVNKKRLLLAYLSKIIEQEELNNE